LRIFIKLAQPTLFALALMGCAHSVEPKAPNQTKIVITQKFESALWHDGTIGGIYGIGEGWSIEILRPEYEWVEDESEDLSGDPVMISTLITLPAEYEAVTDTITVEREKTEYYLTKAIYNSDGTIKTAKIVKPRIIPAVTKEETRQVVIVPERTVERTVPLERRKGYRRVVKLPDRTMEDTTPVPAR